MSEARTVRYVVLRHTGFGEDHFDLMIEPSPGAEKLLTWRTPVWPLLDGAALRPLGEHRRDYLQYEGPVSRRRGWVQRVAQGSCRFLGTAHPAAVVRFDDEPAEWELGATAKRVAL